MKELELAKTSICGREESRWRGDVEKMESGCRADEEQMKSS